MARRRRIIVKAPQQLAQRIEKEQDALMLKKLMALRLYDFFPSMKVEQLCAYFQINKSSLYSWIAAWNRYGYEGLKDKRKNAGRPCRLNNKFLIQIQHLLKQKPCWTTVEIQQLLQQHFHVQLSTVQLRRILKNKLKMHLHKPSIPKEKIKSTDKRRFAYALKRQFPEASIVLLQLQWRYKTGNFRLWSFYPFLQPQWLTPYLTLWAYEIKSEKTFLLSESLTETQIRQGIQKLKTHFPFPLIVLSEKWSLPHLQERFSQDNDLTFFLINQRWMREKSLAIKRISNLMKVPQKAIQLLGWLLWDFGENVLWILEV